MPFTAQDIRFTTRADVLYATPLGWPGDGMVSIKTLAESSPHFPGPIGSVELLGDPNPLMFERTADALVVHLPASDAVAALPVLRITPAIRRPDSRTVPAPKLKAMSP